jgi:hypothetical protein
MVKKSGISISGDFRLVPSKSSLLGMKKEKNMLVFSWQQTYV